MTELSLSVQKHTTASRPIIAYFDSMKPRRDTLKRTVLDQYRNIDTISAGTFIFTATENIYNILGIALVKREQINLQVYHRIKMIDAPNEQVADALVLEIIKAYKSSNVSGLLTESFDADSNDVVTKALIKHGFKPEVRVYASVANNIVSDLKHLSHLEAIEYSKSTRSQYRREFIKLLIEHDEYLNKAHNRALGKNILPSDLKNNPNHKRTVSYFVESIARLSTWHAFLLKEENEDTPPVGFIKVKVSKDDGICFPDIYLPEKYISSFEGAYRHLFKSISKSGCAYVGALVCEKDQYLLRPTEKVFGKPVAYKYFMF